VHWDPGATSVTKADAEYCFVSELLTQEGYDARFPDEDGEKSDWQSPTVRKQYGRWLDVNDQIRVAEYWRKKRKPIKISLMEDGSVVEGDLPDAVTVRDSHETVIERYVLSGSKILEGPEIFPGKNIPIVPVFGPEEFVDNRVRYRSIIRHAKDAQRMYNYWQTSITEKIALSPRVPFVGTVEQFKGLERMWGNVNNLNKPFIPYNPDPKAPGPPMRVAPAAINASEIQQAQQSIEDIKATIGIYDASLGAQGNETSGRAILARQREGDTSTFAWIDNLSRAIEHAGRILIDLIPHVYDSQRVMRVLGEDDSEKMVTVNEMQVVDPMQGQYQILNDLTVGKYDVKVSVGPSYATKRLEAADSLMGFMQAYPAAAPLIGDLVAKNMDWPGAEEIATRLKKTLPPEMIDDDLSPEEQEAQQQQMQMAQQEQEEQKAMQSQMFQLEAEGKMADIKAKMAKTAKDMAEAEAQELENDAAESGMVEILEQLNGGG
jgi:hypothetical protein